MTHTISPSSHHLADSCQGWPKLLFAVYERDATALVDSFVGYGVAALPLSPGAHDVSACVFVANDRNARAAQSAKDLQNMKKDMKARTDDGDGQQY